MQIVPARAFEPETQFDLTKPGEDLAPLFSHSYGGPRYNFDGLLTVGEVYGREFEQIYSAGYLQVFRNGIIETVNVSLFQHPDGPQPKFHGKAYEHDLIDAIPRFLSIQKGLAVDSPLILILTFIGVQGYRIMVRDSAFVGAGIDRDILFLPEVVLTDYADDIPRLLKPAFDSVWNAAGWPGSPNYDPEGNWISRQ